MSNKQTLSERKREAILNAAINEFDQRGFQKTSMDQIAAAAQVSKRTVYNHFPSKESLFKEITATLMNQGLAATQLEYKPECSLKEQLTAIAKQEMELLKSKAFISLSRLILAECLHTPDMAGKSISEVDSSESGLIVWLKQAVADQRLLCDDLDFASKQFLGLIKSFAFWPQVAGYGDYPEEDTCQLIVESAVSMFLNQYQKF